MRLRGQQPGHTLNQKEPQGYLAGLYISRSHTDWSLRTLIGSGVMHAQLFIVGSASSYDRCLFGARTSKQSLQVRHTHLARQQPRFRGARQTLQTTSALPVDNSTLPLIAGGAIAGKSTVSQPSVGSSVSSSCSELAAFTISVTPCSAGSSSFGGSAEPAGCGFASSSHDHRSRQPTAQKCSAGLWSFWQAGSLHCC